MGSARRQEEPEAWGWGGTPREKTGVNLKYSEFQSQFSYCLFEDQKLVLYLIYTQLLGLASREIILNKINLL